jgi:hypothetical protein
MLLSILSLTALPTVCNFTGANDLNLIRRGNPPREVHTLKEDGLCGPVLMPLFKISRWMSITQGSSSGLLHLNRA